MERITNIDNLLKFEEKWIPISRLIARLVLNVIFFFKYFKPNLVIFERKNLRIQRVRNQFLCSA